MSRLRKKLDALTKQYPSKTKKYMSNRPDEEQYRSMCPNLGTRCTSQGAESANKVNEPFRTSTFGDILGLSRLMWDRYHPRKKEVGAHTGPVPPKTTKAHAQQAQLAALVPALAVQFVTNEIALVNSQVDANKSYIVDFDAVRKNDRKGMCDGLLMFMALACAGIFWRQDAPRACQSILSCPVIRPLPAVKPPMMPAKCCAPLLQLRSKSLSTCGMIIYVFLLYSRLEQGPLVSTSATTRARSRH